MIDAAITGASGYAGYELIKVLSKHPKVNLKVLNSRSHAGKKVSSAYSDFRDKELKFTDAPLHEINKADVVFLALHAGEALDLVPKLKPKVIDLGADYRFNDARVYERVYGKKHAKKVHAAYGLPELFREKIKKARVIGNPGCYPTASLLGSLPADKLSKYIVLDCKSGYSGAGMKKSYTNDPANYSENIIPYNISMHRHKFEMEQFLKTKISFTPHVLPTFRGLMCTAHILLKKGISREKAMNIYHDYYKKEPFVRVIDGIPTLHDVQNTNYCVIGGFEIDGNNQMVVISVIDNLLKGASGQAVQNMNIMFGFDEKEGLA